MAQLSTYLWPGKIQFGAGASRLLVEEATALAAKSLFIMVDPGVRQAGLLEDISAATSQAALDTIVYDEIVPNPDIACINDAVAAFRESGAGLLVGCGGGSALDAAKAVKLMVGGPPEASIEEYANALGTDKRPYPRRHEMPPYIAMPTTAGTGAEVTPWAVITDAAGARKFGVGDDVTIPDIALVDPELTLTLPPHLTAATGMDALSHLVESYVSTNRNPLLDPLILTAIQQIGSNLRTAVARGDNLDARTEMMQASLVGGIAISSNWLGACHSLAHPLSGLADVHHGLACGIMLPHQMAYSLIGALDRYADIAEALDEGWFASDSVREKAFGAVTAVSELLEDIGLPTRLSAVGVKEELIPVLAKAAYADLNWWTNPREVNEEAMLAMCQAAL